MFKASGFIHGEKEKICVETPSALTTNSSLFNPLDLFIHGVSLTPHPSSLTPLN